MRGIKKNWLWEAAQQDENRRSASFLPGFKQLNQHQILFFSLWNNKHNNRGLFLEIVWVQKGEWRSSKPSRWGWWGLRYLFNVKHIKQPDGDEGWHHLGVGGWKANVMTVASNRAWVYQGPRLWTGGGQLIETALLGHQLQIWIAFSWAFIQFGFINGCAPHAFSHRTAISHTLAFLPLTCCPSVSPLGGRGAEAHRGFRWDLEKMQTAGHRSPRGTSPRFSPWTWTISPNTHTHTPPHSQTEDLLVRAVAVRRFKPCTF